ncbi:MAG TPA: DUF4251 domain-containing protein [Chitinophagaceae bacterium]|nr:DUF4251 domain-containing protein [Chitinophagaceae bacterium]HPH31727.1 DUF4251 domain-containing protein [Chitinophagaceae bacterium]
MKKFILSKGILYFFSLLLFSCSSGKQAVVMNTELENAIVADSWKFIAEQSTPQFSGNRGGLDAGYEVRCSKERLESNLPYYGRSFSGGGAYTNQGPLDFKTGNYTITKEKGKKNSWILNIRPGGIPEVREYRLTVFSNGTASLDVQLNNRTPMSFRGRVEIRQ